MKIVTKNFFLLILLLVVYLRISTAWWFFSEDESSESPEIDNSSEETTSTTQTNDIHTYEPTEKSEQSNGDDIWENVFGAPVPTESAPGLFNSDKANDLMEEMAKKIEDSQDCSSEEDEDLVKEVVICDNTVSDIRCCFGKQIQIQYAQYGRTPDIELCGDSEIKTCPTLPEEDTKAVLDELCQNQFRCSIDPSKLFENETNPCPGTPRYLIAKYKCGQLADDTPVVPVEVANVQSVLEISSTDSNKSIIVASAANSIVGFGIKNNEEEEEVTVSPTLILNVTEIANSTDESLLDKAKATANEGIDKAKNAWDDLFGSEEEKGAPVSTFPSVLIITFGIATVLLLK